MHEDWDADTADVARSLRAILADVCTPVTVRDAEAGDVQAVSAVRAALDTFGLGELPPHAPTLSACAVEFGRALVPLPIIEQLAVAATLGLHGVGYGLEGTTAAGVKQCVVRMPGGRLGLADVHGRERVSTAGDDLVVLGDQVSEAVPIRAPEDAERLWRCFRLLHSARMVGAAQRLLEMGVAYAGVRKQFGKPVGAFQAVSHRLVDAHIALSKADLVMRKAAVLAARDDDVAPPWHFAVIARCRADDAGRMVASAVHQVTGGYGFTVEEDYQLYTRRIRGWAARLSDARSELRELGRRVIDSGARDQLTDLWHNNVGIGIPRWAQTADGTEGTG